MFEFMRRKITISVRRSTPGRWLRRFTRRQDGVAAVEFAFIAVPFLALLFAILETALVFFAGQTLEAAVADSARLIMTGQAQSTNYATGLPDNNGWDQGQFKSAVCARVYGLFDCQNKLYVDVRSYSSFDVINTSSPIVGGQWDSVKNNMQYTKPQPYDIVVVTMYYEWPIAVTLLDANLVNLTGGSRLLIATSVFRTEPYK